MLALQNTFLSVFLKASQRPVCAMYHSEMVRVKRIERFLERLAYSSMAFDAIIAAATFLVIRGNSNYSGLLFMAGDYLIFVEILLAAVAFVSIIAMRHYNKVIEGLDKMVFRAKYKKQSYG